MPPKFRPIKNKTKSLIALDANPPSHPIEHDATHRAFLKRSLDRSDVELAAIQTLHRSLRSIQRAIVTKFGEGALLDIAEGRLISVSSSEKHPPYQKELTFVRPDEIDDEAEYEYEYEHAKDETFRALARDYILRLKLRRRLLNRIARRLMRLSHFMDGKNVKAAAPMYPQYGEVRLLSSCEEYRTGLKQFEEEYTRMEAVRKRVKDRIRVVEQEEKVKQRLARERKEKETEVDVDVDVVMGEEAKDQGGIATEVVAPGVSSIPAQTVSASQATEEAPIKSEIDTHMHMAAPVSIDPAGAVAQGQDTKVKQDAVTSTTTTTSTITDMDVDTTATATATATPKAETASEAIPEPEAPASAPPQQPSTPPPPPAPAYDPLPPLLLNPEHQADLTSLIQYDTEYTKQSITHASTSTSTSKTYTKSILTPSDLKASLEKTEEDFDFDENVVAKSDIGATRRGMNDKEKVMEWKRWKAQVIGKIPDQPTFEDLNVENVFCLKERREALVRKMAAQDGKKKEVAKLSSGGGAGAGAEEEEEEEGAAGIKHEERFDDDSQDDADTEDGEINDDEDDDDDKVKPTTKSSNETEKTKLDKVEDEFKKKKPFSLDPVPSFHDQDYHRCLTIQSDLLSNSLKENSRQKIANATLEYNNAFRMSSEYQSQKIKLEAEQKKALLDYRVKLEMWTANRTMAYAKWENEKKMFEAQLMARKRMSGQGFANEYSRAMQMDNDAIVHRALSGAVDRVVMRNAPAEQAMGTDYTASLITSSNDHVRGQVATSLAHCVDMVAKRVERGYVSNAVLDLAEQEAYPPFDYPSNPRTDIVLNEKGETLEQLQARVASQIQKVTKHLNTCEQVRSQKWSKLMKAKQEAQGSGSAAAPTATETARSVQKSSAVSASSYAASRVQSAAAVGAAAAMRSQIAYAGSMASSSAAAAAATPGGGGGGVGLVGARRHPSSDTKYSAEAVKARMSADGSVRPINMPKQTKDGLYLRPAGRQRKGMDWDAVNGIWVPTGSLRH